MKAKEYYKSTRMVDTMQWTLDMAMSFAEEYHKNEMETLRIHDVSGMLCGSFDPDNKTSSATKCKCGREKWEHPKPRN
jgi:predicted lipoprotein with Yx(FWY)xxD motif